MPHTLNRYFKAYLYIMLVSFIFFGIAWITYWLRIIIPTLTLDEILIMGWGLSLIGLVVPLWLYIMLIDTWRE